MKCVLSFSICDNFETEHVRVLKVTQTGPGISFEKYFLNRKALAMALKEISCIQIQMSNTE